MSEAYEEYKNLREKNLSPDQISTLLGLVLKDDAQTAFKECKTASELIKLKTKEYEDLQKELTEKHPHTDYFNILQSMTNVKQLDVELAVCNDAIKLIELKKTLLLPEVKDNPNFLEILHNAIK